MFKLRSVLGASNSIGVPNTDSENISMDYKAVRVYTGSGYEDFKVGKEIKASHITQENLGVIKNIRFEDKAVVVTFVSGDVFYYYGLNFRAQL